MKNSALILLTFFMAACGKAPEQQIESSISEKAGIVGGELVPEKDFLHESTVQIYTVQLRLNEKGKPVVTGLSSCTGTLLTEQVLVSAAHCTGPIPGQMLVYFSKKMLTQDDFINFLKGQNTNPLLRQAVGGLVGDNWPRLNAQKPYNWGDISLIKFPGGIPEGYKKAQIIPKELSIENGSTVTLAGYGITDGTLQTETTGLRKVEVQIEDAAFSDEEILMKTGNGKGSCHGDSGGPAYLNVKGQNYLIGVTSRADLKTDPRGLCIGKTVYTSLQAFSDWIQTGIAKLESPQFVPEIIPQP